MSEHLAHRTTHIAPSKPLGISRLMDTSQPPLTTAPHDNSIELLRQELLRRIDGQASNILALKSSNDELKSSNTKLTAKVEALKSSNSDLKLKVNGLKSSNDDLKSSNDDLKLKVNGLRSSNTELSNRVRDMSNMLQNVSQRFSA